MFEVKLFDNYAVCSKGDQNYKLDLVSNHKEFGNVYIFSNILNMPYLRKAGFDLINQYQNIGVDKKEVQMTMALCKQMIKENKDVQDIYVELDKLESRVKDIWDYKKTSISLVGLLCIPESQLELIGEFEQSISESNINMFSKDNELISFFFDCVQIRINSFWNTLDRDMLPYSPNQTQSINESKEIKHTKTESSVLSKITRIFKS
jgi:hypothetical protein